jgi:hypothetical protein
MEQEKVKKNTISCLCNKVFHLFLYQVKRPELQPPFPSSYRFCLSRRTQRDKFHAAKAIAFRIADQ